MNLTNRTEVTSEIHHSLRTIVVHACEFVEQALLNSIHIPISALVQSQRKVVQGNFIREKEILAGPLSTIFKLTSVAKDLATCAETLAVALIYGAHLKTGPTTELTNHGWIFVSPPEKEVAIVNAESREREFSLTLEILRDASRAFIGLREFPFQPNCLSSRDTGEYETWRRRNIESRFGLLHTRVPTAEELERTHQPERRRARRRSSRKQPNFEVREFPITPAESVETGVAAEEFVSDVITGNHSLSSKESPRPHARPDEHPLARSPGRAG